MQLAASCWPLFHLSLDHRRTDWCFARSQRLQRDIFGGKSHRRVIDEV
jgi:hypothetical protein